MKLEQQRKLFLRQRPQTEPTILMHRTPSPGPFDDNASSVTDSYLDSTPSRPHYMKPLRRQRAQGATLIPTLDMFAVVRRRAVNVWEKDKARTELPTFQRQILPSHPLSSVETRMLQQEYAFKLLKISDNTADNGQASTVRRKSPRHGRIQKKTFKDTSDCALELSSGQDGAQRSQVFVTQMSVRKADVTNYSRRTVVASRKHVH